MAFLSTKIQVKLYTDSAETEFPEELIPSITKEASNDAVTEVQAVVLSLAALGAQTINLNGVGTVKRFYAYSSTTDVSININSLGNLTLTATEPGLIPFTVSSMVVTNASATTATTLTIVLIAS